MSIDWGIADYSGIYTITNDPKANELFTRERIFWLMQYGWK